MSGSDDGADMERVLRELEAAAHAIEEDLPTEGLSDSFLQGGEATRVAVQAPETLGPDEETEVFDDRDPRPKPSVEEVVVDRQLLRDAILEELSEFQDESVVFESLFEPSAPDEGDGPGPGTIIDNKYRIVSVVDGHEFVVEHLGVHQEFELRFLPQLEESEERQMLETFRRASILADDNLAFVTDLGQCPQFGLYAVGERVVGDSIQALMESGEQVELQEALGFLHDVGGALSSMHDIDLAHGLSSDDSVVRSNRGTWKVMRPGFPTPPKLSEHAAPEVLDGQSPTPRSDQYSLAFMLYALLVGTPPEGAVPFAPTDLRADLPPAIDEPIMKALDITPDDRHASVVELMQAVQQASQVWREPTVASFDAREASRILAADKASPDGFDRDAQRSVIVRFDVSAATQSVEMVFSTADRLRREFRRNIIAAGMFLPMNNPPQPPANLKVKISYAPRATSCEIDATMVTRTEGTQGSPAGGGLVFEPEAHQKLMEFLRGLQLGMGLQPDDLIDVIKPLSASDNLNAGEAFLMSRLASNVTVGAARSMFAGLPFDFDEAIESLLERGFIGTRTAPKPKARRKSAPQEPKVATPSARPSLRPQGRVDSKPKSLNAPDSVPEQVTASPAEAVEPSVAIEIPETPDSGLGNAMSLASATMAFERFELSPDDVEKILQVVDYFEERQNYMSAIDVLERSLAEDDSLPALYHRLAMLKARFENNLVHASNAINRAIRLDSKNEDYRKARRYIKSLQDIEAQQPIFQQMIASGTVRFLRVESSLNRVWAEVSVTNPRAQRRIVCVDYSRRTVHGVIHANNPKTMHAVPGDHPRFLAFSKRLPTRMNTIRERRQKLLEAAKSASDFGPWFFEAAAPIAWTQDSTYIVVPTVEHTPERGLYLVNTAGNAQPFRLDPETSRSRDPRFSTDGEYIAWVTTRPTNRVHVAPCLRQATVVHETESEVFIRWNPEGSICMLESDGKYLVSSVKGGVREVGVVRGKWTGLVIDPEHCTGLAIGASRDATALAWFDLKSGEIKGTHTVPFNLREVALREDGLAFGRFDEGGVGVDMRRGRHHELSDIRILPGSLEHNTWNTGEPLILLADAPEALEVLALNVRLLVNS